MTFKNFTFFEVWLIAHENEVYDIAFSKCTAHGFASVGGDGSGNYFILTYGKSILFFFQKSWFF